MKNRVFPIVKAGLLLLALLFELFAKGAAVMLPETFRVSHFSFFSLTPLAYGNFAPMFTAAATCIGLLLALFLTVFCRSKDLSVAVCFAGVIGFVFSLGSLLFGRDYYSGISLLISLLLFAQLPLYITGRLMQRQWEIAAEEELCV